MQGGRQAGFRVQGGRRAGFRVQGGRQAGFNVQGGRQAGFRVQGGRRAGFRVQGGRQFRTRTPVIKIRLQSNCLNIFFATGVPAWNFMLVVGEGR